MCNAAKVQILAGLHTVPACRGHAGCATLAADFNAKPCHAPAAPASPGIRRRLRHHRRRPQARRPLRSARPGTLRSADRRGRRGAGLLEGGAPAARPALRLLPRLLRLPVPAQPDQLCRADPRRQSEDRLLQRAPGRRRADAARPRCPDQCRLAQEGLPPGAQRARADAGSEPRRRRHVPPARPQANPSGTGQRATDQLRHRLLAGPRADLRPRREFRRLRPPTPGTRHALRPAAADPGRAPDPGALAGSRGALHAAGTAAGWSSGAGRRLGSLPERRQPARATGGALHFRALVRRAVPFRRGAGALLPARPQPDAAREADRPGRDAPPLRRPRGGARLLPPALHRGDAGGKDLHAPAARRRPHGARAPVVLRRSLPGRSTAGLCAGAGLQPLRHLPRASRRTTRSSP